MITLIYEYLLKTYPEYFSLEANTPALSITRISNTQYPFLVNTPRGIITTKNVVHCTEGHAAHLLPGLRGILVPRRGQMTVQTPGNKFPRVSSSSWSFIIQGNLDYATQNPWSGEIFIGGGEGQSKHLMLGLASDAEEDVSALAHLGGVLPAVFGPRNWGSETIGNPRLKASWSGILCNSLDSMPLVGQLPETASGRHSGTLGSQEWISAGYGGYGMVNAFLCGKNLAQMIRGEEVDHGFPPEYRISPTRMQRLHSKLREISLSQNAHLKALL